MEFRKSTEKRHDESTYSHIFEMNKTKNEESMLETTRNDISMNSEVNQAVPLDKATAKAEERNSPNRLLNTADSPTGFTAKSIDVESVNSPMGMSDRAGSGGFSPSERLALNRTTMRSKNESETGSLPQPN